MSTVLLFASFFLRSPEVVATFVIATVAVTFGLYRINASRGRMAMLAALASGASLGLIVAFTWLSSSGNPADLAPSHWDVHRIGEELDPADGGLGAWRHGTDGPLNVLLYVPAGLTLVALVPALRQVWRVPVALALLSLITEVWQALNGTRSGQLSDVASNTIGALLGATAGMLLRLALNHRASRIPGRRTHT